MPAPLDFVDFVKLIPHITFAEKMPLWMDNLAENMPAIRAGRDIAELERIRGPALVVGAGRTIVSERHLEKLRMAEWPGCILSTDRMLVPLLESGVIPDYACSVDGDPSIACFYDHPLIDKWRSEIKLLLAVTVHPGVVGTGPLNPWWFCTVLDNPGNPRGLSTAVRLMTHKTMIHSGGNVGATLHQAADFLGADPVGLVGLDYSYPVSTRLEDTTYWEALKALCPDPSALRECFRIHTNPHTGKRLLSDPVWEWYASCFVKLVDRARSRCTTINCSPRSLIFGEGIRYMPLERFIERYR